jgi:hypothetical protein
MRVTNLFNYESRNPTSNGCRFHIQFATSTTLKGLYVAIQLLMDAGFISVKIIYIKS